MRSCDTKLKCERCGRLISKPNYSRHLQKHERLADCDLHIVISSNICPFCGKEFTTNSGCGVHAIYCKQNPNKKVRIGHTSWCKGLTKDDPRVAKSVEAMIDAIKGRPGRLHTDEEKEHLREIAYQRKIGGFFMRRGIDYNGIKLDSSYEVEVAKSLDANNIKWERCKRFPYVVNGKLHYYTPDFYLPDYNIYLDPKNDFLLNNINPKLGYTDKFKIEQVMSQNNIKIILLDKTQLNWDYIKQQI